MRAVMFSRVSVCPRGKGATQPPPPDTWDMGYYGIRLDKRAVRILLECFFIFAFVPAFAHRQRIASDKLQVGYHARPTGPLL